MRRAGTAARSLEPSFLEGPYTRRSYAHGPLTRRSCDGYHLPNHCGLFCQCVLTLIASPHRHENAYRGSLLSDSLGDKQLTESTERPATTEQDVPGVTTQVTQNDVGSAEDLAAAYEESLKAFEEGDIVDGHVVKVDRDEVLLDIGYKSEGVIPSRELSIKHDVDPNEVVSLGDHIEALVMQKEDKDGRLILSKKRAQYERAWGTIEKKKENDEIVEGTVIEVVKGGLILDIGLRGFLPASLVEMRRVRDLQPYVGRNLEAKINKLAKGQVRSGVVSSIVNFGAFVDLGGVDGLVHVSELSWKHIDHPSEVVEVGQEVTVEVLDVDLDRERVSLSLKATQEDPWRQFA